MRTGGIKSSKLLTIGTIIGVIVATSLMAQGQEYIGPPIFSWQVNEEWNQSTMSIDPVRTDGIRNCGEPGADWGATWDWYWHTPVPGDGRIGLYPQLYAHNFPLTIKLRSKTAPLSGWTEHNERESLSVVLDQISAGNLRLDFVFFDFELATASDIAEAYEVVNLVRQHPDPRANSAAVGGWPYFPSALNVAATWPHVVNNSTVEMTYRDAGLNCAMPVAYPSDWEAISHTSFQIWGTAIAPNARAALFWSPLERVSAAKRNLPDGHLLIPWVSSFIPNGLNQASPPVEDNKASIIHYRLRGVDGYFGFNSGKPYDPNSPWDSDEQYQVSMLSQWHSLDWLFDTAGTTTILNLETDKTSDVQWSGVVRGSNAYVLVSNLNADPAQQRRVALPRGYGLPSETGDVGGGQHVGFAYVTNGNVGPVVNVTSPAYASHLQNPNVDLTAAATDSGGSIERVEFYSGSNLLAVTSESPYHFVWAPGAPGVYTVTAKAYDNLGAVVSSKPVVFHLDAPPSASIAAPPNGISIVPGTGIYLVANASDDGVVNRVEFFQNGVITGTAGIPPQSGLQLWLKSDAGVVANGRSYLPGEQYSMVSQWTDQSGQGHHATSDGANAPWMVLSNVGLRNKQPVVHFGYQLDEMILGWPKTLQFTLPSASSYSGFSLFYVASKSNTYYAPDYETALNSRGGSGTPGIQWDFGIGPDSSRGLGAGGPTGSVAFGSGAFAQADAYYPMSYVLKKGDGWTIRRGEDELASVADNSFPTGEFFGSMTADPVWTHRLNGNIAEVLVYDREIQGSEFKQVNDYLSDRYFRNPTFQTAWTPTTVGSYQITAKAYDSNASATLTSGITVNVAADSSLKCFWNFHEANGAVAGDSSGLNNSGLLTASTGGLLPTWVAGQVDGGLQFDGATSFVQKTGASQLPSASANQTESFWFYVPSAPSGKMNALSVSGATSTSLSLGYLNATTFGAWKHGGQDLVTVTGADLPSTGNWHHVAYVRSGSSNLLYIDGVLKNTTATTPNTGSLSTINAGCSSGGSYFWAGKLDEIRIYNRALSASEIATIVQIQRAI